MSTSEIADKEDAVHSPSSLKRHGRPQRVLACVLCQQRKVKCERRFPCANCIRSKAQCVPAMLAPRVRRRRFPERDLLDRIQRYEDLLRQHNVRFEPLHGEAVSDKVSPKSDPIYHSDDEESFSRPEVHFEFKNVWDAMLYGTRASSEESASTQNDPLNETLKDCISPLFSGYNAVLFSSMNARSVNLPSLHPGTIQIFKLWQIYLDNIDPLLKITHPPSLQSRIIEAAGNVEQIPAPLEALMFGIYSVAVMSIDDETCQSIMSSPKADVLARYQIGVVQALTNSDFLRSDNVDCLTALYLYLISLTTDTDARALSIMLGMAMRMAHRLGIHSESQLSQFNVLEAEVRRRLWWSLTMFDARTSETSDLKTAVLSPSWNCKIPLNLNDSDLHPQMKEAPAVQGNTSEALFAVVRSEVGNYVRHATFYLDFTNPSFKLIAKKSPSNPAPEGHELEALEKHVEEKYLQFCDPQNPLHLVTLCNTRAFVAKCRLLEYYWRCSNSSFQRTQATDESAERHAFTMLEYDTKMYTTTLTKRYLWLVRMYFPMPAYIYLCQRLKERPCGAHADMTWAAINANYEARLPTYSTRNKSKATQWARVILNAWEARVEVLRDTGAQLDPPKIVSDFRSFMSPSATAATDESTEAVNAKPDTNTESPSASVPTGWGTFSAAGWPPDYNNFFAENWQAQSDGLDPGLYDFNRDQTAWTAMDSVNSVDSLGRMDFP